MSFGASSPFSHEASQIELLPGNLETEFTAQQIANFKQAFGVFDVNKDGRISTQEIFEVLQTMGNEVSIERQNKIKAAVVAVDVDRSGDLDFAEFIQFMKIMDEHNKVEAVEKSASVHREVQKQRTQEKYFGCIPLRLKPRPEERTCLGVLWNTLVVLGCCYSLGHAIFIGIIIAFGWNELYQNPETNTNDRDYPYSNTYAYYILYARYANYANALLVAQIFTHKAKREAIFALLKSKGYTGSWFNLVKYVLRPIFVLNAAISVVFIGGIIGLQPTTDSIQANWVAMVFPAAVIAIAYFDLSPYLYFNTIDQPANFCEFLKILVLDLLLFNWIRLILGLVKNVFAILLLPFVLLLTFAMWLTCCCSNVFDTANEESLTSRFLRIMARVMG